MSTPCASTSCLCLKFAGSWMEYLKWVPGSGTAMRSCQKRKQQHTLRLCSLAYVMPLARSGDAGFLFTAIACAPHHALSSVLLSVRLAALSFAPSTVGLSLTVESSVRLAWHILTCPASPCTKGRSCSYSSCCCTVQCRMHR